jgi:hypothetical protein
MPNRNEVIQAINKAIYEVRHNCKGADHPPLFCISSLSNQRETCGDIPCTSFAGALLEAVLGGKQPKAAVPIESVRLAAHPDSALFHVCILGDPSYLNHTFCVYFYDNSAFVIQVFIDNNEFVAAYNTLFGVTIKRFEKHNIYVTCVDAASTACGLLRRSSI